MIKKTLFSFLVPILLLAIMWFIKLYEISMGIDLGVHGVLPRTLSGLQGILFSPFLHGSINHLLSNTLPFLLLMAALIYFYEDIWLQSFIAMFLLSGIGLWCGGRDSYHIGASGIIYALTGFLFTEGILRREVKYMAISLLVVFMYGGTIWAMMPMFKTISWEAHLFGFMAGVLMAIVYKNQGPKKTLYQWEKDEVDEMLGDKTEINYTFIPNSEK
ncbi:MAG: rhomboid family intramembrane serine protease [Bacteroidia bacterium]|nr:rhomboid family intramembrane serine protease [Bacteroidia bacterium]HQU99925.1 rhomboid family intramembrane serine protease [Bacteroidia bacterium]